MFNLVFILPLLAALLCLVLNRAVPTRWLGMAAAAGLLVCGAALVVARLRGASGAVPLDYTWMAIENRAVVVRLALDGLSWALALLALGGGGLALLALALGLPRDLRGFGGLFGSSVLALLAVAAGLADQSLQFLPFLWATAALLIFLALRASGALAGSDAPAIVLLAGLWGSLLVLGATLLAPAALPGSSAFQITLVLWTLVGLLALGGPPFHAPFQDLAQAPAALAGALLPVGVPLLGGTALIRLFAAQGSALPPGWRTALTLLGLLMLCAGAAGALGAARLRRLVSWQLSAQMGLLLVGAGQGGTALTAAAPALLANGALAALACYLAVALIERRAGTDHLPEIALRAPLALPGAVFLIGAGAAVGLPGTWGFWPHRWLIDELLRSAPWAVAPLLAGTALLALSAVAPAASFFRHEAGDTESPPAVRAQPVGPSLVAAVAAVALLALGVFPRVAWNSWLAPAQAALLRESPVTLPALPGLAGQVVSALAALGLVALPLVVLRSRRRAAADLVRQGVFVPQAIGESLSGLAWVATPGGVFTRLWSGLLGISRILRLGLSLFEQRYYLAGLVIAVIIVVMLFIQ
jgi:formate hydrogenlyase subunit 3/multisubunit Na+/H+ antiporter MnhD subunit